VIGRSFLDDVPASEHARVTKYINDLCHRRGTGSIEHRVIRGDGQERWFTWTDRVLLDDNGVVVELQSIGRDITEKVAAEQALRESEERIRTIADNIPGVVYSYVYRPDAPRQCLFLGSGLAELLGPNAAARVRDNFDSIFDMLHPDDRVPLQIAVGDAIGANALVDVDCRLRRDDGEYTWVRSLGRGIPLGDGGVRCWHVVLIDISEHKRFEDRQQLLMNELDHRVKNNLAAVLALARQAARASSTVEQFSEAFEGRIAAMSRTHEFLAASQWDGLEVADVARITLGPYLDAEQPRVCAQGPRVRLPAAVAMPLSLAMHELGANAVKHGALSNSAGTVDVRWREDDGHLCIHWSEAGGPPVPSQASTGTGTSLLNGFICFELRGELELDFRPDGLHCAISIPMRPSSLPSALAEAEVTA
jgi:two-component sensor histidine kinase